MTTKIYGPWIKWDGGECPVPFNTVVEATLAEQVRAAIDAAKGEKNGA